MKKILLGVMLALAFMTFPSQGLASVEGLAAELVGYERTRSSFPDSDGISFSVKVTNKSLTPMYRGYITARIPNSSEYESGYGVFAGQSIEYLAPGESVVVEIGSYLISRSKKLKGKVEFAFSQEFISSGQDFSKYKTSSASINSVPLAKAVDDIRSRIDVKQGTKSTSKKYYRGTENAKIFSLSLKGSADMQLGNPGFTYLSNQRDLLEDELTNLTLWSGKNLLCGPEKLSSGIGAYSSIQHEVTFVGCSIDLKKNKSTVVTLQADISPDVIAKTKRSISFSTYNVPMNVDIYSKNLKSKEFTYK